MSDRVRLTTRGYDPKTAATNRQADPYTMNQPRRPGSEPGVTKYESGTPDSWAETPNADDLWKAEYAKGRNEVGVGNFLDDTWKDRQHPAAPGAPKPQYENKTATEALKVAAEERAVKLAEAKKIASKALHLTHALFPSAGEKFIFAQARDFMMLPEVSLDSTIARILSAGEEAEEKEEEKTAGDVPEAFKKQWDKNKDDKDEDKKEATVASDLKRLETRLASIKAIVKKAGEEKAEDKEEKEASLQMIASLERRLAGLKAKMAGEEKAEEPKKEEESEEKTASRLQAAVARLSGRKNGGEEKAEEKAEDEAKVAGEDEKDEDEAKTAGEDEKAEDEDEAKVAGEDEEDDEAKVANELEIELEAPSMETASEGDLLDDIFTAATQGKTASAKPVKKGVTKLGGHLKAASSNGIDDLSSMWKSDPDVSGDFR